MTKFWAYLFIILGAIVFGCGVSLLLAWPLMLFINYTLSPDLLLFLFGVCKITFLKAWALNIITHWLFTNSNLSSQKS